MSAIRRGTSLIEVLTAIFIMALGLVALLTLFPLGALQMARSVQDERSAQLAANAAAYMRTYWKGMCEQAMAQTDGNKMMFQTDVGTMGTNMAMALWFPMAMDDPNAGITTAANGVQLPGAPWPPAANMNVESTYSAAMTRKVTPSFPVFVDPIGWRAGGGANSRTGLWMGVAPPAGRAQTVFAIPRRTFCNLDWQTSMITRNWSAMSPSQNVRTCMLADDMGYSSDGVALVNEKSGQYSCAWLLRREKNNVRSDVTMTVVVYSRRSTESLSAEPTYLATPSVTGTTFGRSVTLHYLNPADKPAIRRGGWILDATMDANFPQGFFYRVTDIGDEYASTGVPGTSRAIDLQLETPLKVGPATAGSRMFVVPDRVYEVFEKGPLELGSPTRVN